MISSTRRSFVTALLGIGITAAARAPLRAAQSLPPLPLRLPEGPMRLMRVLERGMGEGEAAAITVRRSWEVQFTRQARGILVSGRQVAAAVEAPPQLAALARLEEQRDAGAMFPLMLSERGAIITPATLPEGSDAVTAALDIARAMIARQALPEAERTRIAFYLGEIHRAGTGLLDALPGDLLFPAGSPIDRRETVTLPEGLSGTFTLHYEAAAQPAAPWLARAERTVLTEVAGQRRRAAETWTLAAS
jgi:hypothetical protein